MQQAFQENCLPYETRIQSLESMLEFTHQILENFQKTILDTKQEQKQMNAQLRDNLAKNNSLRRKDFDRMMQRVLSVQDEKEITIRKLLNSYLDEQKDIKDDIANGQELFARQLQRKEEIALKLKEFQKQQAEMTTQMKALLAKGKELRIRDVKSMLDGFDMQHQVRAATRQKLKEEMRARLDNFKNQRKQWRMNRIKPLQTMGSSSEIAACIYTKDGGKRDITAGTAD